MAPRVRLTVGRRAAASLAVGAAALAAGALGAPGASAPAARGGAQRGADAVRLNQVAFYPAGPKVAVVADPRATSFAVVTADGDTALAGTLSPPRRWAPSDEEVRTADFGRLTRPGRYALVVPGVGRSHPFAVSDSASRAVARAALKAFYFQRVSTPLPPAHAGPWSRPAGHPDDAVLVHPSAAGPGRPAGARVAAPYGWYDAGDYNKYVVNSGISTYTLLALHEHFPAAAPATGIPESRNALPDVVDEGLWNLRWMRAMQDPADGGVYHKLTNADFDGMDVMPHRAVAPRYVVQKSTAAALNFAAVAAQGARVARAFPRELPGLADSLAREAAAAWRWARRHPDSLYVQSRINERLTPKVATGEYGDRTLDDEFRWAASELWVTTRQDSFLVAAAPVAQPPLAVPSWGSVGTLGVYSLFHHRRSLPPAFDAAGLERRLLTLADTLVARARASAYGVPMTAPDFVWGSSAVAANQGIALVQAYRLTRDSAYLNAAVATLDYLLGRNATGYSFVTGYGARTPRWPHHRPSVADTVAAPVPGMLVGGPNPRQQDRCAGYPSRLPALSYVDSTCSYASNEIAINWNAPLAYLAAAIDALYAGRAGR